MNVKNNLENKIVVLDKDLAPKEDVINFYKYLPLPILNSTDSNNMAKTNDEILIRQAKVITLDQIIKMAGERIGPLKLDCEGCEYSVLNSFSDYDIIYNLILEYHNGIQNLPNLLKRLRL